MSHMYMTNSNQLQLCAIWITDCVVIVLWTHSV